MLRAAVYSILFAIAVILALILIIASISDLHYHEMGLLKNTITGSVYTDKVYMSGRHFVGLFKKFKTFRVDRHDVEFYLLTIYNKEKIKVTVTCSLQYLLRPEDLVLLHDTYDIAYEPVLRSTSLAAIKGAATHFTVDEYRLERNKVASGLQAAAATVLGGICCRKNCDVDKCKAGCKKYEDCTRADKGLFAELIHFQLQLISITKEQETRFLRQVLEQEKKDTEDFIQAEMVTRKQTEELVNVVDNFSKEIAEKAIANSTLIKAKAKVEARAMVEDARNQGLQIIYSALNITDEEHKKTLDYIRTLRDSKNATMFVGFQYMIAKP